jgi:hypothetical protein
MVQTNYRINRHHTSKKNPLMLSLLLDFITCYDAANKLNVLKLFMQLIILKAGGGSTLMTRLLSEIKLLLILPG